MTIYDNVVGTIEKTRAINWNPVSGYTVAQWDIIVRRNGISDTGTNYAERSAWTIAGVTDAFSDNYTTSGVSKTALYLRITGTTDAVVTLYKTTGGGAGDAVATGTETGRATGGVVTLVEANSSGISGTVTLADACTNVTDAIVYVVDEHDRFDFDVDASLTNILGIYYTIDSDTSTWKTIIEEADNVVMARLGYDNVDGEIGQRDLKNLLIAKNIRVI
jgi:hypothetical protein